MSTPRTVVITGGSFGLGLAMAEVYLERGDIVVACGRSESTLADAQRHLPALRTIRADVSVADDRERLMEFATRDGSLDVLINNAAIVRAHDYTNDYTLAADRAADEIAINFAAPIELCRLFLAWRRAERRDESPGTIVNINTPGGLFPLEANLLYSSTKAGLHMFTLALRRHLAATPVTVVEVFPPGLDTGLTAQLDVEGQEANGAEVIAAVARTTVEAIVAGNETICPHEQAAALYAKFAVAFDEPMLDAINVRVKRRPGWDKPVS